jgi:5-methylcytosine-specific restriction endonuclease McrA
MSDLKTCAVCRAELSRSEFHKDKTKKDGLVSTCKPCAKARATEWYLANPERAKEARRGWDSRNRDHLNALRKQQRKDNPERFRAKRERLDKGRQAENVKRWVENNRDRRRMHALAHQNKRRHAPGTGFTADDVLRLLHEQNFECVACRASVQEKRHVDHIVPLSRGGRNDLDNIQILCPPCNLCKRARDNDEFMRSMRGSHIGSMCHGQSPCLSRSDTS